MVSNKKRIKYLVRFIVIIIASLFLFCGMLVLKKYIREEKRTYTGIEEIIEKNYNNSSMQILSKDNYFYLIDEKKLGNKEELIKFENGKYIAFDNVLKFTKGIDVETDVIYNDDIDMSYITVFEYHNEYIIIVKRDWNQEIVALYDNYGVWEFELVGDYFYYFKVHAKDKITHEYIITAVAENETFEIGDMATINKHVYE